MYQLGVFILILYIFAIVSDNVPLGMFYSHPVHFGHLGPNSTSWEFHCLSLYRSATLGENVPAGGFLF